MSDWVRVAAVSEVPPGDMKSFEVQGKEGLVANVDGTFHAIGAICTHAQWDLSEGTLEGARVTCAGHGSVWDLETGEAEFVRPLPSNPVYETEVRGDDLYLML